MREGGGTRIPTPTAVRTSRGKRHPFIIFGRFHSLYNGMQDVTTIPVNCDYFFMREGIKPMWEDPANKGGCDFRAVVGRNMDTANMWKMAVSRIFRRRRTPLTIIASSFYSCSSPSAANSLTTSLSRASSLPSATTSLASPSGVRLPPPRRSPA